ncbi:MAG: UPF0182 family protein [Candidatus Poribacteria bacterium]|nr:UPF0182 family protein [Candidatus Poribacteria bacterium]
MESRVKRFIITISILAVLGGIIAAWVKIYPDWLWFNMVEYPSIYIKILKTKIFVGVIVGIAYLAILLTNLYIVYRLTPAHLSPAFMGGTEFTGGQTNTRKMVYGGLLLLAVLFSILMGYSATDRWEIYLRYTHAKELNFQAATPIIVEDNLDSSEITVSPLELAAKKIQVGDEISIHIERNDPITAQVEEVKQGGIRINTPVQIEQGQKAYFKSLARDPIFDKDVAYYVFKMPMERYIIGTLFGIFLLVTIFAVIIYFFHGLITGDTNQIRFQPPARVKAHLFTLVGLTLLFRAWNYQFVMYDLLYTSNDVVRGGGGYAAINARLPILWIMLVITVLCATVFIVSIFLRRNTYAFGAFVVFIIAGFLGQLYPQVIQRWRVEPQKQVLETEFINYNIKSTLHAYNLEDNVVTEEKYPLTEELTYNDITSPENVSVINNIRLWDWRPLRRTFRELQKIRPQYDFHDVDIDRYTTDTGIRQVMLSAREINEQSSVVSNDWYTRTYIYTHGYGAVVSPVNEIESGKPNMFISQLPPIVYEDGWSHRFNDVPGPRIYYGERTNRYVIVHPDRPEAKLLEFDYPQKEDEYAKYAYQGKGGVHLSSFWRKLVYMLKFDNELNFILPGEITSTSRIMYERNIKRRVRKIAPFLRYDGDPYIVLHDGRIVWILDAYTITHRYPYAVSMREYAEENRTQMAASQGNDRPWGNYIRNSVKVVIDAYDGTVNFYHMKQEQDPIAQCYDQMFPGLFKSFEEEMPDELKAHIRYPATMFRIQARVYTNYHMKDPGTFYAQEDRWEIGKELYDSTDSRQIIQPQQTSPLMPQRQTVQRATSNSLEVAPYYVVLRPPRQEKAEFMLMLPFTPVDRTNLTAWFAARCDRPEYGQILVYRFPKREQVAGPWQVENFISQKPEISEQISLWNQQGTRVLRGNLLILPMNNDLLYVEPIYIQSEDEETAIPELRRVVIGYEENDSDNLHVAWGKTLDEALREVFLNRFGLQSEPTVTITEDTQESTELPEAATSLRGLIEQANNYYNNAQNAQRNGNWAEYGRNIGLLEQTLKQLQENARQ